MADNATTSNPSKMVLDYKNYQTDMATEVSEFLKETLVFQLNTNKAFVPFRDAYEYPYNETPMASIPSSIPSMVGMGKLEKKLTFTQVLLKHKQVEEWPEISRQITASISLMLSKRTHSKIKSVYFEEWQQAIANGKVSKMIKLIHNGLTLKTSTVKQYDRILVKKQILEYTRNETESCNESNERFLELRQRGNAMGAKKMGNRELTLIYLFAQKKFYNSKPVMQVEVYLDDMISKAEHQDKSPKLINVMKGLREIEARLTQYATVNDKKIEAVKEDDSNIIMSNEQIQPSKDKPKDKPYKATRNYKSQPQSQKERPQAEPRKENLHTTLYAAKQVMDGKYSSMKEAIMDLKCDKCYGKYHVSQDCRKQTTEGYRKGGKNNPKDLNKQAYCMDINQAMQTIEQFNADSTQFMNTGEYTVNQAYCMDINQSMQTIEQFNTDSRQFMDTREYTVMMVDNDTTIGITEYFKTRYNYDNHANINVFNNKDLVTNIRPTNDMVAGYGGNTQLRWECEHPIFGTGFFDENSKYNLIGMAAIRKVGFNEFKPREARDYTILCHPKYGDITFKTNEVCPFYSIHHTDLMQQIHLNAQKQAYPIQTSREYTDEQYRRAEDVIVLHKRLGHPGTDKLKAMLDNNLLVNTILTSQDLKRAQDIFGRCDICDIVKPIKVTNQHKTYSPKELTIGEVMHVDIIFMSAKDAYLLTVESLTDHLAIYRVTDKKNILEQIKWMIANAKLHGHNIRLIRPDSENILISNELRQYLALNHQIKVDAAIPLEHEKTAESNVARIRTRMRCINYELYYRLPSLFVGYLLMYVIDVLNMTPNAKIKNNSPAQLYEGHKPNYLTDLTIAFGAACIVSNTDDLNKLHATHTVGIALGRSRINKGGIYIWIPGKNIKVRRVIGYTKLTRDMIDAIHTLPAAMGDFKKPVQTNTNHTDTQPNIHNSDNDHEISRTHASSDNLNNTGTVQPDIPDNSADNVQDISRTQASSDNLNNTGTVQPDIPDNSDNNYDSTYNQTNSDNLNNTGTVQSDVQDNNDNDYDLTRNQTNSDNFNNVNTGTAQTINKRQRTMTHTYNTRSQIYTLVKHHLETHTKDELTQATHKTLRTAADYNEIKQILDFNTCKFLKHISHRDPSVHTRILPTHFVRTVKYNKGVYLKHKSRLTAGGNFERGINEIETSSPTVSYETIMIQLAVAVAKNHRISSIDYQAAFLNAPTPDGKKHVIRLSKYEAKLVCAINPTLEQYIQQDGTLLAQLEKSLYGLREAGKLWFDLLTNALKEIGFISCTYEQPLFKRGDNEFITVHVDDLLLTYTGELGEELMNFFKTRDIPLKINHLSEAEPLEHLGVIITMLPDKSLTLSQQHYIKTYIIDEYNPKKVYITPAINADQNLPDDSPLVDKSKYLQKLMRLYYVAARTRPDILTACSYAAVVTEPTESDDMRLNRIIGYLLGTSDLKMHITKTELILFGSFDASFAIHRDYKSHSGKIIYLGHIPIWCKSTKQKANTKASAHAELNTLYEGLDIILWCRAILNFMLPEFPILKPTVVYQDNLSTIKIANMGHSAAKSNSRYINCRTFWVKDLIDTNQIDVQFLPSDQMISDALASIRTGSDFTTFRTKMQIYFMERQVYQ